MSPRIYELMDPICPTCGNPAPGKETRFGTRHECCGLHSWDGKPLVEQGTHDARKIAHAAFDSLWKGPKRIMKRKHAYRALAQALGMNRKDCHIALMDKATALRVPEIVDQIRAEHPEGG